jgi:hypothetical protein
MLDPKLRRSIITNKPTHFDRGSTGIEGIAADVRIGSW